MSKSNQFSLLCFAFIIGIGINSIIPWFNFFLIIPGYLFILVFLFLIFLNKKYTLKNYFSYFFIFFLILGLYCFELSYLRINNNFLYQIPKDKNCIVYGIVSNQMQNTSGDKEIILKVNKILLDNKTYYLKTGKIIINSDINDLKYGDSLEIKGKIGQINNFDGFNYRMFLAKDGIYAKMSYPKISFVSSDNGNYFLARIYDLRYYFEKRIGLYHFNKEQFSIISAMMLGDTDLMMQDLKDKLKFSGLSHIIAISGSHIAIFSEIIISLCLFLKISKKKAISFAMLFAWLFIIFSGFAMSAIRSGIMGGIYLLSKILNRQSAFVNNFLFALAIILAFNPILLVYDIGLQLSFASIAGIFYLTDFFTKKLFFIPRLGFIDLRSVMAMTISAQLATLGIVIYHFSEFYPLGLIANLLVVPIAYYLMFCSLFFIIFASVWTWLGYIFYFPTLFFLSYFQGVLNIFYKTQNIKIIYNANLVFIFVFYGILGYTIYRLEEHKKDLIFSK